MESERRDIERLAEEVSGLNEGIDTDDHSLVVDRGSYRVTIAGGTTHFERDEHGQLVALRGPMKRSVLERDEHGQLIAVHTEREEIVRE